MNNRCLDFSKKEKNDKRGVFDEDALIVLLFLPASRPAKLS